MPREFQGPSRAASKLFEIGLLTSGARVDTPAPPGCSTQVWPRCARPLPSLPCPALVPALVELPALTEAVLLSESLLRDSDCVSCALGEDTSALGGRTNPEGRSARAPCALRRWPERECSGKGSAARSDGMRADPVEPAAGRVWPEALPVPSFFSARPAPRRVLGPLPAFGGRWGCLGWPQARAMPAAARSSCFPEFAPGK